MWPTQTTESPWILIQPTPRRSSPTPRRQQMTATQHRSRQRRWSRSAATTRHRHPKHRSRQPAQTHRRPTRRHPPEPTRRRPPTQMTRQRSTTRRLQRRPHQHPPRRAPRRHDRPMTSRSRATPSRCCRSPPNPTTTKHRHSIRRSPLSLRMLPRYRRQRYHRCAPKQIDLTCSGCQRRSPLAHCHPLWHPCHPR